MRNQGVLDKLAQAVVSFDSDSLKKALHDALKSKIPVDQIIREGLGKGMEIVGEKYENGEYFLSELIMSGTVMNEAMEQLKPLLKSASKQDQGRILIGTVEGDLHDIGKNLVKYMLESAGFDVVDLGTDVSPQKFVEETRKIGPAMLCMSALLSVTVPKVRETIEALNKAGLRERTKVLVGGRCLSTDMAAEIGADAYGKDAWDGMKKAKEMLKNS
jgi:methanogenic corrinoid protein MtbC1